MRKKSDAYVVTTLPENPKEDYNRRVKRYSLMMGVRFVCILLLFVVPLPWSIAFIIVGVFTPWFAVVIANSKKNTNEGNIVEKPYKALE